jgi:hypothetical protein
VRFEPTIPVLEWAKTVRALDRVATAIGIRHANHVAPSIRKKLALTSLTSGGRSVGVVRLRTEAVEFLSISRFSQWTLFFSVSYRNPATTFSLLPVTCPSNLILSDSLIQVICHEDYNLQNLSLCSFLHFPIICTFLGPDILHPVFCWWKWRNDWRQTKGRVYISCSVHELCLCL